MALWVAISAFILMVVSGVLGFRGEATTQTALARLAFAAFMIVTVASIAILAR